MFSPTKKLKKEKVEFLEMELETLPYEEDSVQKLVPYKPQRSLFQRRRYYLKTETIALGLVFMVLINVNTVFRIQQHLMHLYQDDASNMSLDEDGSKSISSATNMFQHNRWQHILKTDVAAQQQNMGNTDPTTTSKQNHSNQRRLMNEDEFPILPPKDEPFPEGESATLEEREEESATEEEEKKEEAMMEEEEEKEIEEEEEEEKAGKMEVQTTESQPVQPPKSSNTEKLLSMTAKAKADENNKEKVVPKATTKVMIWPTKNGMEQAPAKNAINVVTDFATAHEPSVKATHSATKELSPGEAMNVPHGPETKQVVTGSADAKPSVERANEQNVESAKNANKDGFDKTQVAGPSNNPPKNQKNNPLQGMNAERIKKELSAIDEKQKRDPIKLQSVQKTHNQSSKLGKSGNKVNNDQKSRGPRGDKAPLSKQQNKREADAPKMTMRTPRPGEILPYDAGPILEWLEYEQPEHTATPIPEGDGIACTPWEVNVDDWWQEHPDWEVAKENATHTCFRMISDPLRVQFLKKVHELQFPHDTVKGCPRKGKDRLKIRHIQDVGFGATVYLYLHRAFWGAFREGRPFQVSLPEQNFRWMYVPPYNKDDPSKNSWATCPTQDLECLFLPVSSCPRPIGGKDEIPKKKFADHELYGVSGKPGDPVLKDQNLWLFRYMLRPRQDTRRHFYHFWQESNVPTLETPCTWMHVRRGDAMTEAGNDRNFHALSEYLEKGKIAKGSSILLLTDDETAIEEAQLLHPQYKWTYWDRKRNRGPSSYNSHFPSHDEALELMIILAETKLAGQCTKGVYARSNMPKIFYFSSVLEHGFANVANIQIDKKHGKIERLEPQDFMRNLEKELDDARANRK